MKKTLAFVLALLIGLLAMISCSFLQPGNGAGGGGDNNEQYPEGTENLIYNKTSDLYVVLGKGMSSDLKARISDALAKEGKTNVKEAFAYGEKMPHEVVIGNTARDVSQKALARLERLTKPTESHLRYVIYSDGSSVAIVADEDDDGIAMMLAIDHFVDSFVSDHLILTAGEAASRVFDPVEDYYIAVDAEYENEMWTKLAEKVGGGDVGEKFVTAMKGLYAIYDENLLLWLANLYEPSICVCNGLYAKEECENTYWCGGAGFYYSNSARDTLGYLPDVESTYQALNLLDSVGITRMSGGSYAGILDSDMREKIIFFVQHLQDKGGYFYHPQWGSDVYISRKSRDVSWATGILNELGGVPYYTTPNGVPGGGAPKSSSHLERVMGAGSVAELVSSVVAAEAEYPEYMENEETFKEYLLSLNIRTNSYGGGNTIASQLATISRRDSELKGSGQSLFRVLIEFLNENQNPETGTWDYRKPGDEGYTAYFGTNGLMKISGAYNYAGVLMPNAEKACRSLITAALAPDSCSGAVDVYNPFHGLSVVLSNLNSYGGDEGKALVESLRREMYENGTAIINATKEKILPFKRADGSYSYLTTGSPSHSQGALAAVPGSLEGDVNGAVLSSSGLLDYLFGALGLNSVRPSLFGEAEKFLFMSEMRSMNHAAKPTEDLTYEHITFEDETIGEKLDHAYVGYATYDKQSKIEVVERADGLGKALMIDKYAYPNIGDSVDVKCQSVSTTATTFVFEGDFCIESSSAEYAVQLIMGSCYMLSFKVSGNQVYIWEESSDDSALSVQNKFPMDVKLGQWFRIKIEYYYGNHDTVRAKLYFDGDPSDDAPAQLISVSDNYYDKNGTKVKTGVGTPSKSFSSLKIYTLSHVDLKMYLDNVVSYKSNATYTEESDPENQPWYNVDAPDSPEKKYDFEDGELPGDVTVSDPSYATVTDVSLEGEGKSLYVDGKNLLSLPVNVRTKGSKCAILSTDIMVTGINEGATLATIVGAEPTGNVFGLQLYGETGDDGIYVALREYNGTSGSVIKKVNIPLGEWARLKIEYYHAEHTYLIYVNDVFVGAGNSLYSAGEKRSVRWFDVSFGSDIGVYLDNVISEKDIKSYAEATAPNVDSKVHDFEDKVDSSLLVGGASVIAYGDGKAVKIDSIKAEGGINIPVLHRANIYSLLEIKADLIFNSYQNNGEAYSLDIVDEDGLILISYSLKVKGDKIELYEVGATGPVSLPLYSFDAKDTLNLTFKIFREDGVSYVYLGSNLVAKSSIFALPDNASAIPASVMLTSKSAKSILLVDNVKAETYYEIFAEKSLSNSHKNENEGELNFETSNTGSIPDSVLKSLASNGSSIRIEQVFNGVKEEYSNVAVFNTYPGSNDRFGIKAPSVAETDSSCVTFEVDIKMDFKTVGYNYHFILSNNLEKLGDVAYMMFFIGNKDGTISINDASINEVGATRKEQTLATINSGEWYNFKVKYYKGDKDTVRIELYLNGELTYVSNNYYGYDTSKPDVYPDPKTSVQNAYFYTFLNSEATLTIDNISLTASDDVCDETVGRK